jgi:Lanthionine synthetase C-like protein
VTALFDQSRHEPLTATPWSAEHARAAITAIAAQTEAAFDPRSLWPPHPQDEEPDDGEWTWLGLYLGAAGMIWALDDLERAGAVELRRDYAETADALHERYLASADEPKPGLWMGEVGILLTAQRLSPSEERADAIRMLVARNADAPENELMWGNSGTMLAAQALGDADLWRACSERLWDTWLRDEGMRCHLWTQQLYGNAHRNVGGAHGFAGNVAVLDRGREWLATQRAAELDARAVTTATRLAVREGRLANWAPRAGGDLVRPGQGIRTQWCHGAPGIVVCLGGMARDDDAFGELLAAGGELTWTAGPLSTGVGLCHGTAGNGFAFLKLFERTGDELWLERARSFGAHAIEQVERERAHYGRGRFSLWTGDLGVAVYLQRCLDPSAAFPTVDVV